MIRSLCIIALLTSLPLALLSPSAAQSADSPCLSVAATQEALLSGNALRLADIRRRLDGDIVKADLCRSKGKLAYMVTVLTRDGMVKRVTVDASSGEMIYGGQ